MTVSLLDMYNECFRGRWYKQTKKKVDWKIVDRIMYFRQSVEKEDWYRNFLSMLPVLVYLHGWQVVPLGGWLTYLEVRKIARESARDVDAYVGVSQGGWPASYASFENSRHAFVFGCPRVSTRGEMYCLVVSYKTPSDIVTTLPSWARHAGTVITLRGKVGWPKDSSILDRIKQATGHMPEEYRQRLEWFLVGRKT